MRNGMEDYMPRKPKPKNALSAGERAALYEAEQAERRTKREQDIDMIKEVSTAEPSPVKREKQMPILPKPQFATLKIDLSMPVGTVKPMHGMCNGPMSYGADISHLFKEIGVPYVRFDETDTAISSYAVDISRIFKNLDADPKNTENYDFSYTDKYVRAAYDSGARVIFRLGESFDRMYSGKKDILQNDIDAFTEICVNIVKHYNRYWADGYAYGIEYFEVLTHGHQEYTEESERKFELYRRVSSALKLIDEDLKVGGMCFSDCGKAFREFLRYCRRTRSPLDFITISSFDSNPRDATEKIKEAIPMLYNLGFSNAEIIIGAWNYIDKDAVGSIPLKKLLSSNDRDLSQIKRRLFEEQRSVKGAAYALAFMISLSRVREISAACFYDAQPNISPWCAISDRFGNPEKTFYSFKTYGEIYKAGNEIYSITEEQDGFAHSGIYSMAAEGDGVFYILISSFDGCGIIDLRLDNIPENIYTADVFMLDGVKNMSCADSIQIAGDKKRLILNISTYGAALVKLY